MSDAHLPACLLSGEALIHVRQMVESIWIPPKKNPLEDLNQHRLSFAKNTQKLQYSLKYSLYISALFPRIRAEVK